MSNEINTKECETCEGEGTIYMDTKSQCSTPMSECCGGCGHDEICPECEGSGSTELETE